MSLRELPEDDRLRALARLLAVRLGLDAVTAAALDVAASLISVGRLSLDDVLKNEGTLSDDDMARVHDLPRVWSEFATQLDTLRSQGVPEIIESYAEHWDGTGYPNGRAGEDIPLAGRALAVCYHYNGMISDRPYRRALAPDVAANEIRRMSGTVLDGALVETFLEILADEIKRPDVVTEEPQPADKHDKGSETKKLEKLDTKKSRASTKKLKKAAKSKKKRR